MGLSKVNPDFTKPFTEFRNYKAYEAQANRIVQAFDFDNDGKISRSEANKRVLLDSGTVVSAEFNWKIDHKKVGRTPYERHATFKQGAFDRVNKAIGEDGLLSANDLLYYYGKSHDSMRKEGELGPLEGIGMKPENLTEQVLNLEVTVKHSPQ